MSATYLAPTSYAIVRDREKFERELIETLQKALLNQETAPKEKHVRNAIIATHQERGCKSFWKVLRQFQLLRQNIVCWKACLVIHRIFLDGHESVVKTSKDQVHLLADLGKHWGKVLDGYSKLIAGYCKVLITKIHFHLKYPEIPSNLVFRDKPFTMPTDVNEIFQMAVDVFDLQSALLHLMGAIVSQLDPSKGISAAQVQCRIHPLIACITESSALYDLIYKLMKTLHTTLPPETLAGHRERFNRQYLAMRKYYNEARKMKYFESLVQIPVLEPDPPQFLLPGQMVATPSETSGTPTSPRRNSLADVPMATASLPTGRISSVSPLPRQESDPTFSAVFGSSQSFDKEFNFGSFRSSISEEPPREEDDEREALVAQMAQEILELKAKVAKLEGDLEKGRQLMMALREQMEKLQKERDEYQQIAEQACSENVALKEELETAKLTSEEASLNTVKEEKFTKLKASYLKLRDEHVQLLREEGDVRKQLTSLQAVVIQEDTSKKDFENQVRLLQQELQDAHKKMDEEVTQVQQLTTKMKEQELHSVELEQLRGSLETQLNQQQQQIAAGGSHDLLVKAIEQVESIVKESLAEVDDPSLSGVTCTPDFLLTKANHSLNVLDNVANAFSLYNNDPAGLSGAILSLTSLSQAMGEVMHNGASASHMAPSEDGEKLLSSCRHIGEEGLKLLAVLKQKNPGSGNIASSTNSVQKSIRNLTRLVEELVPKKEHDTETLGDILEEEMTATALAVDEAAARIEEMLRKSKKDDSGVKLEVNGRILDSCTDLMGCIKLLIQRSQDLQSEIVGAGRGGLSANEFYKKNNRWSEGLISAAKAVGWGASILVNSADKVVQGSGKFEELVVASHDIAASTAQLVAASRAKAHHKSERLKALKAASRRVTEATGTVVASAQSGATLKRQDSNIRDYSQLTLTQAKRLEMESQVHALELEQELADERTRLAELRKVHYHLGGSQEGWEDTEVADA